MYTKRHTYNFGKSNGQVYVLQVCQVETLDQGENQYEMEREPKQPSEQMIWYCGHIDVP